MLGISGDDELSIPSLVYQNIFVLKGVYRMYLQYSNYSLNCLLYAEPLGMDQHLKVVREATWEARAEWRCLGEQLGVTMGKLEVKNSSLMCYNLYLQ